MVKSTDSAGVRAQMSPGFLNMEMNQTTRAKKPRVDNARYMEVKL